MTVPQQDLFILELALTGNLAYAMAAAGVSHQEAMMERFNNPAFEQRWRTAQRVAFNGFQRRQKTRLKAA